MRLRIEDTNMKTIVHFNSVIFLGVMQLVGNILKYCEHPMKLNYTRLD